MKEEKIIITIDKTGKIIADAQGFEGEICIKDMEVLLKDIAPVHKISKKDEYYQTQQVIQKQRIMTK